MRSDKEIAEKFLTLRSSRHHYVPQFLINGFVNANGLLYVYDKKQDCILKKQRPPKSIFSEFHRNTLDVTAGVRSSILEDGLYAEIDSKTGNIIRDYQTGDLASIVFDQEENALILFFLIVLFRRIPKTDFAAEDLISRSVINATGVDPEDIRHHSAYRKLSRAGLYSHHIKEMKEKGARGRKYLNVFHNSEDSYILGDYPFILQDQSGQFSKFNDLDVFFALSSRRVYTSTIKKRETLSELTPMLYNTSIIEQSVQYIVSGSRQLLKRSIIAYKQLKEKGLIYFNRASMFETNDRNQT